MKILKSIDQALARVEGWFVILLLTVMMLLAFTQVVLRNVWNSGLIWGDIVLRHLVLWIGFLGAALAASQNRHINVDALTRFLSPRVKGIFAIVMNLFASVICFLLFRAGMTFIGFEIADRHEVYAQIPSWYVQVIIPAGFFLLAFHFFIRAAVSIEETVKAGGAA